MWWHGFIIQESGSLLNTKKAILSKGDQFRRSLAIKNVRLNEQEWTYIELSWILTLLLTKNKYSQWKSCFCIGSVVGCRPPIYSGDWFIVYICLYGLKPTPFQADRHPILMIRRYILMIQISQQQTWYNVQSFSRFENDDDGDENDGDENDDDGWWWWCVFSSKKHKLIMKLVTYIIWLVFWNICYVPIQLGISSSQLTNIFQRGRVQPPTSIHIYIYIRIYTYLISNTDI